MLIQSDLPDHALTDQIRQIWMQTQAPKYERGSLQKFGTTDSNFM